MQPSEHSLGEDSEDQSPSNNGVVDTAHEDPRSRHEGGKEGLPSEHSLGEEEDQSLSNNNDNIVDSSEDLRGQETLPTRIAFSNEIDHGADASSVTTAHFDGAELFVPSMYPSVGDLEDVSDLNTSSQHKRSFGEPPLLPPLGEGEKTDRENDNSVPTLVKSFCNATSRKESMLAADGKAPSRDIWEDISDLNMSAQHRKREPTLPPLGEGGPTSSGGDNIHPVPTLVKSFCKAASMKEDMLAANSSDSKLTSPAEKEDAGEKVTRNSSMFLRETTLAQTVFASEELRKTDDRVVTQPLVADTSMASEVPVDAVAAPSRPGATRVQGVDHEETDDDMEEGRPSIVVGNSEELIQAYTVEQSMEEIRANIKAEMEEEARQNAVEANVVDSFPLKLKSRLGIMVCVVLGMVVLATVLALLLPREDGSKSTLPPMVSSSTLSRIRERGYVICGVYDRAFGFSIPNPLSGQLEGMNADQCRAIAVALFGNPNAIEFVLVDTTNRFQKLANGTVDVLATTATHNFQRDVYYGKSTMSGFTFSAPYLYSGLAFWGPPEFLECAEALDAVTGVCQNLTVCVTAFSTHEFILRALLPHQTVVSISSPEELVYNLDEGKCVTLAAEIFYTNVRRTNAGSRSGTKLFSNEPLCLVTREDDHEFSSLVDSVVNIFFFAEQHGISRTNAEALTPMIGPGLAPLLVPIVAEFGNYADLYQEHLESLVPRHGLNTLYSTGDRSGLLYAFPLGFSSNKGLEPDPNGEIVRVQGRGFVRCGVVERGAALADFDMEFCRALSAGLFHGSTEALEVSNLSTEQSAFEALKDDKVDVLVGMRLHMIASYKEPSTDHGFALSSPYYYDTTTMEAYGLVTNKDDPKWSDLVDWTARATIIAVEMGVEQTTASDMPQVNLFGSNLNLFEDVVKGVGSYNEIYIRTLEATMPQAGSGNELNMNLTGPQQFALPFQ